MVVSAEFMINLDIYTDNMYSVRRHLIDLLIIWKYNKIMTDDAWKGLVFRDSL